MSLETNLQTLKQNSRNVPTAIRVKILNKYLLILKNLKIFKEKIGEMKDQVSESLKKYSLSSRNKLANKFNEIKDAYNKEHEKILHVKSSLTLLKDIIDKKNFIQQKKDKVSNLIKEVDKANNEIKYRNELKKLEKKRNLDNLNAKIERNRQLLYNVTSIRANISKTKNTLMDLYRIKNQIKEIKDKSEYLNKKYDAIKQRQKAEDDLKARIKNNKEKLYNITLTKQAILNSKNKLVDLYRIKKDIEQTQQEQKNLHLKYSEIKERERQREKLKEEIFKQMRKQRDEEELKKEKMQSFLQKAEKLQQSQNTTYHHAKLIEAHQGIIDQLVNTLADLKALKEIHKNITEHKEQIIILEKIKQTQSLIREMMQIVETTKEILHLQEANEINSKIYEAVNNELAEKIVKLQLELKHRNTGKNVQAVIHKLNKLKDLNEILKNGSVKNHLRNERLKRLISMNQNTIQEINTYKLQKELHSYELINK